MRIGLITTLIIIIMCSAFTSQAHERTTRKGLKIKTSITSPKKPTTTIDRDTIFINGKNAVKLSGYDKPLRSRTETLFATNQTTDTIRAITLRITYLDMHRRQLHSAQHTVAVTIPPQSTRQISFRSWDKQLSFYYILSAKPRSGTATPYDVKCTPINIIIDRHNP